MSEENNHNNYHDNNFNLNEAPGYALLLQVRAASFDYAVVNDGRLLLYVQNTAIDELANPKYLKSLLSANYKKVVVGLPVSGLTLIPNSLYSDAHAAGYARFLDVGEDEKVLVQPLDSENKIIYKTSTGIISTVEKFGLQNAVYIAKGWIKAIADSYPTNDKLFLELGDQNVHFLHFLSGKLRFYNTFEFKNPDELLYFTALVCEELNLNNQDVNLFLSGNVSSGDAQMNRLKDFYPKVELNDLRVVELPDRVAPHKMLPLVALSLCESSEEL
ncbi:MAG TPA: DUF3822 family protein [Mucilaginibacter sp.]|jgi:hypothetical protein|nr:DUF3822 family protein [Mucilaginibacter sp.]